MQSTLKFQKKAMYQPKCNPEEIHDYLLDFKSKYAKTFIFKILKIRSLQELNRRHYEIKPGITIGPEELFSTAEKIAEIYGLEFSQDWRKKYDIWLVAESVAYLLEFGSIPHTDLGDTWKPPTHSDS